MSRNERPGVYTSYEVNSTVRGFGGGGAVGLAAAAGTGTPNRVVAVSDYTTALTAFGSGSMAELAAVALENGAGVVYCCGVGGGDYESAFAALMAEERTRYMLCDSRDAAIHGKMRAAIEAGDEKSRYRIGIVESGDSTCAALTADAQALNSERMVLVSGHCETGAAGAVAAAVGGTMAGESDPAVPLNGAVLRGVGGIGANFSDSEIALLVRGGVLPLETLGGKVCVVRGITTRTSTAGTNDATWREVNTILIVDTVIPAIRDALHTAFARAKNTAQTRGAIRTRVIIELERYLRGEIIEYYDDVTVSAGEDDSTVCEVRFGFGVAHGLNIIELSAHITV